MIREINKDPLFLSIPSTNCTKEDLSLSKDLYDTLNFYKDRCVGMAANMIGVSKNAIIVDDNGSYTIMYNPVILKQEGLYVTEEGCLSLPRVRTTKRYKKIKVQYLDTNFKIKIKTYEGLTAQIIQHEIDHTKGILI